MTADLCWRLHRKGGHFSIENPKGSYAWGYTPLSHLLAVGFYVDSDQRMYGLVPPRFAKDNLTNLRIKKPTRLLTNIASFRTLERKCDKTPNPECMESVFVNGERVSVAASAGRYPRASARAGPPECRLRRACETATGRRQGSNCRPENCRRCQEQI